MKEEKDNRFSVVRFARRQAGSREPALPAEEERKEAPVSRFHSLTEKVRHVLVATPGSGEAEKMRRNELLNRAVLGYAEERRQIMAIIGDYLIKNRISMPLPPHLKYDSLSEAVFAEIIGLDVLELILKHKEGLEEIQVMGRQVFEVRSGRPSLSAHQFASVKDVERIQQNLVLYNRDTFNPRKRWAEVMLSDGSRATLTGCGFTSEPTLTIRFYLSGRLRLDALCLPEYGTMDCRMAAILRCLIRSCFNMVAIGSTNSGKTVLIKALIAEMPDHERIVTMESRLELMLKRDFPQKNIVEYEYDENDPSHSAVQAFKLALRQSPQRICHAEIRDQDANVYVRACTRGHEGSITSVHVNELEDAPEAITDMCMLDGRGMNPERMLKRIANFVTQIGLHMALVDGRRKLVRIGEFVFGQDGPLVRDIVRYDFSRKQWLFPQPLTSSAARRIRRFDETGYADLKRMGVIVE